METSQLDISEEDLAKAKDALRVLSSLLPEGGSSAGVHRSSRTSTVGGLLSSSTCTSSRAGPSLGPSSSSQGL